ncbi:MAG: 1-acyl-sn-glycerol-3-phosphate acyltransferase, partial [Myxococcota bacterium]
MFQKLQHQGTLVLVPTHSSNLDSPVIGWGIYQLGLPPFTYGAGLNLFHNPLLAFFMRNLGAYRVDRKKTAPLYKQVLKAYATLSIEKGQHNLFFPGGTRSRSNRLEQRIKKGLLSTGLDAYFGNLLRHKEKPKVFFIPCTINYQLVMEAETLIDDFLKESGKSRYIIEDDESSDIKKVASFLSGLASLNGKIHLVFGRALDPFGNLVDEQGISYDCHGRSIEIERYLYRNATLHQDPQRNREYTQELALQIAKQFRISTMITVTQLVAYAAFVLLKRKNPDQDLFRLLHTGGIFDHLEKRELLTEIANQQSRLRTCQEQEQLQISPMIQQLEPKKLLDNALRLFACY